jgi:hypothetical protein
MSVPGHTASSLGYIVITTALLFIFRENIPTDGTSSKFWKKIIIAPSSKILL